MVLLKSDYQEERMKKVVFCAMLMAVMLCSMIFAGCTESGKYAYSIDYTLRQEWRLTYLDVFIIGEPNDLLVTVEKDGRKSSVLLQKERMMAGFPASVEVSSLGGTYDLTIRESDLSGKEGRVVYKEKITLNGCKLEITDVVQSRGVYPGATITVFNSGGTPVHLDKCILVGKNGEHSYIISKDVNPGRDTEIRISGGLSDKGDHLRIMLYSGDSLVASYEGVIS